MHDIESALQRLADLSDGDLSDLEGNIISEFEIAEKEEPTAASVDRMTMLADSLDSVRVESSRRAEMAAELSRRAAEAASRVHTALAQEEEPETEPPAPEPAPAPAPAPEPEPVTPASEPEMSPAEPEDEEEKPVFAAEQAQESNPQELASEATLGSDDAPLEAHTMTASSSTSGAGVVVPPAAARPVVRERINPLGVGLAITAGADIPGYGSGAGLADMYEVSKAMAKRLHVLRNATGDGAQHTVATLSFEYPEDRRLTGDDSRDIARINQVISSEALVAAAGICVPLEPVYDINVCGVTDRPVRDALARFNADRGGVKIYPSPSLTGDVGLWDPAAPAIKVCADAVCPTPDEIQLGAVYACLNFSNFTSRFFPEVVKANTDLALIHHARVAEQSLLGSINAASVKVTVDADAATTVGAARKILLTIHQAAAGLRRRYRLGPNSTVRTILPDWLLDAIVADIALQMPGDGLDSLALAESQVNQFFTKSNIRVTWALDEVDNAGAAVTPAAQAAGALDGFPTTVNFPIFPEGSFLFLDGGTLDIGVVRDVTNTKANEYATFIETFEGAALTGCQSLWVTLTNLCISGAAAALVDTSCTVAP